MVRMFFGRYPMQERLDAGLRLSRGGVVGPVPREVLASISAHDSSIGATLKRQPLSIIFFTIMLTSVTVLDSGFAWVERIQGIGRIAGDREFCAASPIDEANGSEYCTLTNCLKWAHGQGKRSHFCSEVQWIPVAHTDFNRREAEYTCMQYGRDLPPCCGGCIKGGTIQAMDNGLAAFKNIVSLLADVGTLVFSFLAARYAMGLNTASDHLEVPIQKQPGFRSPLSNLEFTQPLAVHFIESIFKKAWEEAEKEGKFKPPAIEMDGARSGGATGADSGEPAAEAAPSWWAHWGLKADAPDPDPEAARPQAPPTDTIPPDRGSSTRGRPAAGRGRRTTSKEWHRGSKREGRVKDSSRRGFHRKDRADRADSSRELDREESGIPVGGVINFRINEEAATWDDFFASDVLAQSGSVSWTAQVTVPRICLGMVPNEQVRAAYLEVPHLTLIHVLPNLVGSIALLVLIICMPSSKIPGTGWVGKQISGVDNPHDIRARLIVGSICSMIFFGVSALVTYLAFFMLVQHVVVVSNLRVFYIRHRRKCLLFCLWARDLRVDIFRHDHDIFHGHVAVESRSMIQRLMRMPFLPGSCFIQVKHGILKLSRLHGSALDVFNAVSPLTSESAYIHREQIEQGNGDWARCQEWVSNHLTRLPPNKIDGSDSEIWRIMPRPNDMGGQRSELHLRDDEEQPIFAWSFKELGLVSSPYNTNTDIVVTTGRIVVWTRTLYKQFDCKTSLCWGACWCACCHGLICARKLPSSMAFMTLQSMLSFTTETDVKPPAWYDPLNPPVKCPCYEECCQWLTRVSTCMACVGDPGCSWEACKQCPRRSRPRSELSLMWRLRQNMLQQSPDLQCAVRPYWLSDHIDIDLAESLGLAPFADTIGALGDRGRDGGPAYMPCTDDTERLDMLRVIMGVAQERG